MMSEQEFLGGFNTLAIYFDFCADNPERLKANASIYYECLKHLGADEWEFAINAVLRERVYQSMPKIAEILNHIEGSSEERAINAFNLALEVMNKVGDYPSVRFSDHALMYALEAMGGWCAFGAMPTDASPMATAKRKEFISIYTANRHRKYGGYLRGRSERENGANNEFVKYLLVDKAGHITSLSKEQVEKLKSPEQRAFNALLAREIEHKRQKACAK